MIGVNLYVNLMVCCLKRLKGHLYVMKFMLLTHIHDSYAKKLRVYDYQVYQLWSWISSRQSKHFEAFLFCLLHLFFITTPHASWPIGQPQSSSTPVTGQPLDGAPAVVHVLQFCFHVCCMPTFSSSPSPIPNHPQNTHAPSYRESLSRSLSHPHTHTPTHAYTHTHPPTHTHAPS